MGSPGSHRDWMSQGSLSGGGVLGGYPCPTRFPNFSWLEERGGREGEVSRDLETSPGCETDDECWEEWGTHGV